MSVSVDEVEVLAANRAFYVAFRARDLSGMDDLWARETPVTCIHPGWHPLRGRMEVLASFRAILGQRSSPNIQCTEATAHLLGEAAFVLCEEVLPGGRLVATNIFVRESGEWRITHHQAGPMAHVEQEDEEAEDSSDSSSRDDESGAPPTNLPN